MASATAPKSVGGLLPPERRWLRCSSVTGAHPIPSSRLALAALAAQATPDGLESSATRPHRSLVKPGSLWLVVVSLFALGACLRVGYVIQAGLGQLELIGKARDIDDVIRDSRTDARTRFLLSQVEPVLAFARAHELPSKGNYRKYVALDRPAAVWFMATSEELAFEPKVWNFPIVGGFTYVGWFNEFEAHRIERLLEAEGWDVHVRTARAYSTGGWFDDPVLSTMFSPREDAVRDLVNVLIHELTHANLLIRDQSTFNESIASFVGDTMAEEYLVARYGETSPEVVAYREELAGGNEVGDGLATAYQVLAALYESDLPDDEKRAKKKEILDTLEIEHGLWFRPNNAALIGFKTYNAGLDELAALFTTCERDWSRFFARVRTLKTDDFAAPQDENIGPVIDKLVKGGCQTTSADERYRPVTLRAHPDDIAAIERRHLMNPR